MTDRPIHVVHSSPCIQTGLGGPSLTVTATCQALARLGCEVDFSAVTWGNRFGERVPIDASLVNVHTSQALALRRLWVTPGYRRRLARLAADADLIHSHGVWLNMDAAASAVARKRGIPHVVSPRGQLSPTALKMAAWKKAIAKRLYVDRSLRRAGAIHALTAAECQYARDFGLTNSVAVIPNGIDPTDYQPTPPADAAGARRNELRGKRLALFIGRIHPSKGLAHLVQAWCGISGEFGDWQLVIAGPDEVGQLAQLRATLEDRGCAGSVTFTGPVHGQDKLELLAAAELFVLPSFTEGFSMSLLEAMFCGVPILMTPRCNFPEAIEAGAGLCVEPTAAATERGLRELMGKTDEQRREMGRLGKELILKDYTWDRVAEQLLSVYRWLLGAGERPACVRP